MISLRSFGNKSEFAAAKRPQTPFVATAGMVTAYAAVGLRNYDQFSVRAPAAPEHGDNTAGQSSLNSIRNSRAEWTS
jgi:hypothetical protein